MPGRTTLAAILLTAPLAAQQRPFHFAYDAAPWLVRQGCAAAECHGGAKGRGGFKLSLFGADPRADFRALVVDRGGRRIDLRAPEDSLVLRKPTTDLEHGGGMRLGRGGAGWRALRDWIAAGTPYASAPQRLDGLSLACGDDGQLRATAHFSWTDPGTGARFAVDEDVTDRAAFSTTTPDVVDVSKHGGTVRRAPGEAWLFARFAGRDARLRTVVRYDAADPRPTVPDAASGPLDRAWRAGLAELGLAPAAAADADTLLRRLYLDLAGRFPTPAERRAFLDAPGSERVAATADRLLADDAFTDVAAGWLADWFEVPEPGAIDDVRARPAAAALRADLRRAIQAPDSSLLDAVADRIERPLLRRMPDPRDRAELFGRAVLGIRLGCARCHDHPLDRWSRDDHLGFAALFVDPRPDAAIGMTSGVLFDDATGEPARPHLLPLLSPADETPQSAHATGLAGALRSRPDAFARNVANRTFAALLGRGLVEPADDHRPTNPTVHPALLDALARVFTDDGFRLRTLVRAVVTSEVYARTTSPGGDRLDAARARQLARREARPMPTDRLRQAVARALTVPPPAQPAPYSASPLSTWLSLWNGTELDAVLAADGNALAALVDLVDDDRERLDTLFELLLTREPTDVERARILPMLAATDDPRRTLRALAHAIILSREFTSIR